jgi:DNA mismatch repair ATPase MutS
MKALLLFRNRDFDPHFLQQERFRREPEINWHQQLPAHTRALVQDLELDTLLRAMGGDDEFLLEVVRRALLSGFQNDVDTVLYRQAALQDCLKNPEAALAFYNLTVEAIEISRKHSWGMSTHYPGSLLYNALDLLESLSVMLRKLRDLAAAQAGRFVSEAFRKLFATLAKELDDDYLLTIQRYLVDLKFRRGVLLSAELGDWNESTNYVLRLVRGKDPTWFQRLLGKKLPGYTFELHERDEAGARILGNIRERAISRVAIALAESADHVMSFFKMLRAELAFYVGCLSLHARLAAKEEPVCFPTVAPANDRKHRFRGLYDVCLSLHMEHRVVGNEADANGKNLVIVTGANQGGKSSFLRSIGLAQVMMQCGMFVGAEAFEAELCPALLTHYKRGEDAGMKSGKFDEELSRMSEIADRVVSNAMVLFNESFAATNEREGSEIANQIVSALLEKRIKVFFVTHLYEFARGLFDQQDSEVLFLRAERKADGTRTFKLGEGGPLETAYGEDLYREVFGSQEEIRTGQLDSASSAVAD